MGSGPSGLGRELSEEGKTNTSVGLTGDTRAHEGHGLAVLVRITKP